MLTFHAAAWGREGKGGGRGREGEEGRGRRAGGRKGKGREKVLVDV